MLDKLSKIPIKSTILESNELMIRNLKLLMKVSVLPFIFIIISIFIVAILLISSTLPSITFYIGISIASFVFLYLFLINLINIKAILMGKISNISLLESIKYKSNYKSAFKHGLLFSLILIAIFSIFVVTYIFILPPESIYGLNVIDYVVDGIFFVVSFTVLILIFAYMLIKIPAKIDNLNDDNYNKSILKFFQSNIFRIIVIAFWPSCVLVVLGFIIDLLSIVYAIDLNVAFKHAFNVLSIYNYLYQVCSIYACYKIFEKNQV